MIQELRILPPLAIARFGAAPTPMDNYDVVVDPQRPLGYRHLRPAETFAVDARSGEIVDTFVPTRVTFTEDGNVRPVAPFLEVWALTDGGKLEQLTTGLLDSEGASASDLRWRVQVANLKVFRRTNIDADKVSADTREFSGHERRTLRGTCPNFLPGKTIPFGHVQYIRPNDAHPEIRLRFTPAGGFVYGASRTLAPQGPLDRNVVDAVYDARPGRGTWLGYSDADPGRPTTVPGGIYAQDPPFSLVSRGYLDDGCDGIVRVTLTIGGRRLSAFGRVGAGPPTYAPDAVPIRTVADELEQALFGPTNEVDEATIERVEEIVRRAFETVRLMNTRAMNEQRNGMAGHDDGFRRRFEPIMARSLVDEVALANLHESLLVALRGGTAPWFADVLRDHDEIGDLSDRGRRKMPALMRGADGRHLTLTRRQIDLIRTLVRGPIFADDESDTP
jgi:hypothetical protein